MSLVSDALRRARQEAAAREGGAAPLPAAATPAAAPVVRRRLVVAVALVGTVLLALAALVWPRAGTPPEDPAVRVTTVERAPQEAPAGLPVVAVPLPPPEAPTGGPPGPVPVAAPEAAAAPRVTEEPGPNPAEDRVEALGPARRTPVEAGARDVFARAELGYATLELDYIAYRPEAPFAQVNGREVVVGSVLLGFTVEAITADAVHLRDDRGPLVIRARR